MAIGEVPPGPPLPSDWLFGVRSHFLKVTAPASAVLQEHQLHVVYVFEAHLWSLQHEALAVSALTATKETERSPRGGGGGGGGF